MIEEIDQGANRQRLFEDMYIHIPTGNFNRLCLDVDDELEEATKKNVSQPRLPVGKR